MHSSLVTYITMIATSTVFILFLGFYVFRKRHYYSDVANYFLVYNGAIAIYCFAAALGLTATTLEQMKFWTVIQYIGLPTSAALGLLFVMRYLGIKATKGRAAALLALPVTTFFLVATNDWHHLHYQQFIVDPELGAPYIYLEIGIWYVVHGIYMFSCMFVAFLLLLFHWKETERSYRPQLAALITGQFVPMFTSFLYLVGLTPEGIDPVPMVLWISSLLYLLAIGSSRLFTLMPIAKDAIFNTIDDGVMVLDDDYRLIEFNQATKDHFPLLEKSMFGMDLRKLWADYTESEFPFEMENAAEDKEVQLTVNGEERVYRVRIALLDQYRKDTGMLLIFTDITELKKLQIQLEHQAYYDELTQINNRRAFMQRARKEFTAAEEAGTPFSVVLMDIDHFKQINDTYGHHIGDRMLVHVVNVCKARLMEGQVFARYGGEEFVLALDGLGRREAKMLAVQLKRSVEAQPLFIDGETISVTLSFGISEMAGQTLDQLLNQADEALYEAKENGRNRVEVYGEQEKVLR